MPDRRSGLIAGSRAAVENLIKPMNRGRQPMEPFWDAGGTEAVLPVRAAYVGEDARGSVMAHGRGRTHGSVEPLAFTRELHRQERDCTQFGQIPPAICLIVLGDASA